MSFQIPSPNLKEPMSVGAKQILPDWSSLCDHTLLSIGPRPNATESQQLLQCTNLVDKSGLNWGDGCIGASKKYLSC